MSAMQGDELVATLVPGYHALTLLHRGEGAVVYRGMRDGSGEPVAIKVLRRDGGAGPEGARPPVHPHIAVVHDTGATTTGRPYIAMDYCPAGSYADRLADQGPLPVAEVVRVGAAVLSALDEAQGAGLVHGDVTPSNLLAGDGGVLLADFPISRVPSPPSIHAAPEVLAGQEPSPAADRYSLASTLWTLLAGHPPFADPGDTSPDPFDYRGRVLDAPPPPVPRADVPPWLQDLLARGLAKQPGDRLLDAAAFTAPDAGVLTAPDAGLFTAPEAAGFSRVQNAQATEHGEVVEPVRAAGASPPVSDGVAAWESLPGWSFFDGEPDHDPSDPSAGRAERRSRTPQPTAFAPPPPPPRVPQPTRRSFAEEYTPAPPAADEDERHPLPEPDPVPPGHHGPPVQPTSPRRSHSAYVSAAVGGIALGAVLAGVLALRGGSPSPAPAASPSSSVAAQVPAGPTAAAQTDKRKAPDKVRIVDGKVIAAVSWRDRSGGKAAHYVVGGPVGRTPTTLAEAAAGKEKAEVTGLNPSVEYCFTVVAVLSVDQVAPADPVCTKRKS